MPCSSSWRVGTACCRWTTTAWARSLGIGQHRQPSAAEAPPVPAPASTKVVSIAATLTTAAAESSKPIKTFERPGIAKGNAPATSFGAPATATPTSNCKGFTWCRARRGDFVWRFRRGGSIWRFRRPAAPTPEFTFAGKSFVKGTQTIYPDTQGGGKTRNENFISHRITIIAVQ